MQTQLESLQNFGTTLGLDIHPDFTQDKRQTIKKYFASLNGISISPVLDYTQLNHFMLGWSNCMKHTATNKN